MAVITQTALSSANGAVAITQTTLSASDTLTYSSGTKQILTLTNTTGGSLTATITGAGATTISPDGLGGTVTVSSGYVVVVAAGACKKINLDKISAYLVGAVTVTGAATMTATLTA